MISPLMVSSKNVKVSQKRCLGTSIESFTGGFWQGGFLSRGFLSGGLCPGGFCPGGFCPDTCSDYNFKSPFVKIWN